VVEDGTRVAVDMRAVRENGNAAIGDTNCIDIRSGKSLRLNLANGVSRVDGGRGTMGGTQTHWE